jgi:hypothetical protein
VGIKSGSPQNWGARGAKITILKWFLKEIDGLLCWFNAIAKNNK